MFPPILFPFIAVNLSSVFADSSAVENPKFKFITIRDLIFFDYNRKVRPPEEGATNVSVGLVPLYVQRISESEGQFTVLCGIDLYWMDRRLSWNPKDFEGKNSILLEYEEIWSPEVRFTLSPRDRSDLKERSPIRVFSDGLVHVVDYRMVTRVARFRTEQFPFDNQRLVVGFAQTSASTDEVKMNVCHITVCRMSKGTVMPRA